MKAHKNILCMISLLVITFLFLLVPTKKTFAEGCDYTLGVAYAEYDQDGLLRPAGDLVPGNPDFLAYNNESYVLRWPATATGTVTSLTDKKQYKFDYSSSTLVPGIRIWRNNSTAIKYSASEQDIEKHKVLVSTGISNSSLIDIALDSDALPKSPTKLKLTEYSLPIGYELDSTYYQHHNFEQETTINLTAQKIALLKRQLDDLEHISDQVIIVVKKKNTISNYGKARSMYRLYNKNSGEHFYTGNAAERNSLVKAGWRYEGIAWSAPSKSNMPVYRLYNKNSGDHHYTISASERNSLIKAGWRDEGIGWYAGGSYAVYRQYNPNAKTGSHNFTTNKAENDSLVKAGWKAEGISWYAG